MAGIWILGENRLQTMELMTPGRSLGDAMGIGVTAMVSRDGAVSRDYFAAGADEVLVLPALGADQPEDAYLDVIADEARQGDPDAILIAATWRGKSMAARLAERLDTGLCSGCTSLSFEAASGGIVMERLAYGGAAVQKCTVSGRPVLAAIPTGTFPPAQGNREGAGSVRELPPPPPVGITVMALRPKPTEEKDITASKIVVGVGRGFERQEDLALAGELAGVLGAEIGCTRPLSADLHWLPEELCIGISGVQIRPDLYLALGVSGQIQHVTGLRHAKAIAAVNKDENAPIFAAADLGLVGDLYDVIPKMIAELKK